MTAKIAWAILIFFVIGMAFGMGAQSQIDDIPTNDYIRWMVNRGEQFEDCMTDEKGYIIADYDIVVACRVLSAGVPLPDKQELESWLKELEQ